MKIFKILIIIVFIYFFICIIIFIGYKILFFFNDPKIKTFSNNECIIQQKEKCHIDLQKLEGRESFNTKIIENKFNYFCIRSNSGFSSGFNCIKNNKTIN